MSHPRPDDMLRSIFQLQTELNDHIFDVQDIRADGVRINMEAISEAAKSGKDMVNDLPNQWLVRYSKAMAAELEELDRDLRWKWWSKDKIDLQNIRVELVDILHFLVSAMLAAGLTADDVHRLYVKKQTTNVARQDSGYSIETKDESDNREIT